jgi:hypothetical protein
VTVREITAYLIAPALMVTGFRFSKDYRHGVSRFHRAVYVCVNRSASRRSTAPRLCGTHTGSPAAPTLTFPTIAKHWPTACAQHGSPRRSDRKSNPLRSRQASLRFRSQERR